MMDREEVYDYGPKKRGYPFGRSAFLIDFLPPIIV